MSTAHSKGPEQPRLRISTDIAQQLRGQQPVVDSTVYSCNRLGRIGNLPAVGFGDWWRRRANRRG
jgi:hypothetical protein